jgi:hypothetical protein
MLAFLSMEVGMRFNFEIEQGGRGLVEVLAPQDRPHHIAIQVIAPSGRVPTFRYRVPPECSVTALIAGGGVLQERYCRIAVAQFLTTTDRATEPGMADLDLNQSGWTGRMSPVG